MDNRKSIGVLSIAEIDYHLFVSPDTISYPLFADADTEFIHTQHRNTLRGRGPSVVLRC